MKEADIGKSYSVYNIRKAHELLHGAAAEIAHMKETDERWTPKWFLGLLREWGNGPIALDVCTHKSNPTRADNFFSPEYFDGLERPWNPSRRLKAPEASNPFAWCQPPYSRGQVIKWAMKARNEALLDVPILMLTQADVSTGWFKFLRQNADSVCLLEKRIGFVNPDGSQMPGAKFGSALWYFGAEWMRFHFFWKDHGWIVACPGPKEE